MLLHCRKRSSASKKKLMAAEGKSEEEKRVSEGEQWGLFLTARERPQIVVLLLSIGSARIAGTVD